MDKTKSVIKVITFLIAAILCFAAGFWLSRFEPGQGTNVQTTDTMETFRQRFNALDNTVSGLAGGVGTSTVVTIGNFPYWSSLNLLNGTSSLRYATSNNLLFFDSGASSSQFWTPSSTITNLINTNTSSTNVDADRFVGVASTSIQTGQFSVNIIQPSSTTDGNFAKHQFRIPVTLTRIDCFDMIGTSTINIERRSSSTPNTVGTAIIGNLTCGDSRGSTSTFVIATGTVNHVFSFQVITATGIGSTSTLTITGQYTK